MEHLQNKKMIDKITERLWITSSSLNGLSGLFTIGVRDLCLDGDEFYGIGHILKTLSKELEILEDLIRCGQDSTADRRNGLDIDEKKKEENEDDDKEKPSIIPKLISILESLKDEEGKNQKETT